MKRKEIVTIKQENSLVLEKDYSGALENFLVAQELSESSKSSYRKKIKAFLFFLASKHLPFNNTSILEYKAYLLEQTKEVNGEQTRLYSSYTVNAYLTSIKLFANFLDIPVKVKGLKQKRKSFNKDALTIDQAKKLVSCLDKDSTITGKRNKALILLMLLTGLRTIELERANIQDIRNAQDKTVLFVQGKGRSEKDDFVVLTEQAQDAISDYLRARFQNKTPEQGALFVSFSNRAKNKRLHTLSIRLIAKEIFSQVGINSAKISTHSLRHTAITLALISGATLQEAQAMARHGDIKTTLIYAQNLNRLQDDNPEQRISNLLFS